MGEDLAAMFPHFFTYTDGNPIYEALEKRLAISGFETADIEIVNSISFLRTPEDVIKLRCFGQSYSIHSFVIDNYLKEITKLFEQHATCEGLPTTYSRYIVRAIV
ncbi:hypothetical protein [Alkalihalobacillus pseudalcaliphilus]|uniref:hypothetical protein n=1 Tax=Alkalihalobacillus pseudalcaliphilus TaxID=79884 RepID=UPI00069CF009|nr:hypothetical protein [Alkalihalobacillus pseudalcaliphilus]